MRIGFSRRRNSCVSKLIQRVTSSEWSHCFLVDESGKIMEASGLHGVRYSHIKELHQNRWVDYEIWDLVGTNSDLSVMNKYYGGKYGHLQIFANVLARLFRSTWLIYRKHVVCSELVTRWLQQCRYARRFAGLKVDYVSPEDVYRALKSHPRAKMEERYENR